MTLPNNTHRRWLSVLGKYIYSTVHMYCAVYGLTTAELHSLHVPLCRDGSEKWVAVQNYTEEPFGGGEENNKRNGESTEKTVKAYGVDTP